MNKLKPILGIDIDDVLFSFQEELTRYHNNFYQTSYTYNDIYSYRMEGIWNCSTNEVKKRIFDFYESENFLHVSPIPGAKEALETLKDHFNFVLITARPETIASRTETWIQKHFPNITLPIYYTNKFLQSAPYISKEDYCDRLNVQFFIDDSLEHANNIAATNRTVLLFDKPWNQANIHPPIYRAKDWREVLLLLLQPSHTNNVLADTHH